jgi:hypothetical protein
VPGGSACASMSASDLQAGNDFAADGVWAAAGEQIPYQAKTGEA